MTTRTETIRGLLADGLSRRAIATRLGVSEKTIRNTLTAESVAESAPVGDWIAPGPDRVVPTPTHDQALYEGGVFHPGKAWIACPGCGHPAWRDAPGVDSWTCGCVVGPHGCHGPRQVPDATGTPQIVYAPYVIRPFPAALPPDAA